MLVQLENTTRRISRLVWLPSHWLAHLNSRAKREQVNFIIHLDKLGHLCAQWNVLNSSGY